MKKEILGLSIVVLGAAAFAQVPDYSKLTSENLPSIRTVVKAFQAGSTSGHVDINAETFKIHMKTLLPRFRTHYESNAKAEYQYDFNEGSRYYSGTKDIGYDTPSEEIYGPMGTESKNYGRWAVSGRWYLNNLLFDREEIYLREIGERISYYQTSTMKNAVESYKNLAKLLVEKQGAGDDPELAFEIAIAATEVDFFADGFLEKQVGRVAVAPPAGTGKRTQAAAPIAANGDVDPLSDPASPLFELTE